MKLFTDMMRARNTKPPAYPEEHKVTEEEQREQEKIIRIMILPVFSYAVGLVRLLERVGHIKSGVAHLTMLELHRRYYVEGR